MSELVSIPKIRSVIADMADKFGMEKEAFESIIMSTVMPANVKVSKEQFVAFLSVAKEYDLNPLTKEIYAFPAKLGGISPIVSVDGWARIINGHSMFDGVEFRDIFDEKGKLSAIECIIYRKDRTRPTKIIEYLAECQGISTPWKNWPARMLRHKALIQCARYAFGFSGIYDQDEAERMIDVSQNSQPGRSNAGMNKAVIHAEAQHNPSLQALLAQVQQLTPDVKESFTSEPIPQSVGNTDQLQSEIVVAPASSPLGDCLSSPIPPIEEPPLPLEQSTFPGDINVN